MVMRRSGQRRVASYLTAGAHLLGNVTQDAGQILLRDGTAGAPPLAFALDTDTGMFRNAADDVRLAAAGSYQVAVQGFGITVSGSSVLSDLADLDREFRLSGDVTPAALTANTDNYAGVTGFSVGRISSTGVFNLTGMTGGADGEIRFLINVGANQINLMHDVTSTAANRFFSTTGAALALTANKWALCYYDDTISRWRVTLLP